MALRLPAAALIAVLAWAAPDASAWADQAGAGPSETDKEQARRLVALGDEKMASGDYGAAYDAYRGADVLMGVPTTTLQVARAELALGRLLEARATLDRLLSSPQREQEPAAFVTARQQASDLRADVEMRIPTLTVEVAGAPPGAKVQVAIDGAARTSAELSGPLPVDPGSHEVSAWVEGRGRVVQKVSVVERDRRRVQLVAPPPVDANAGGGGLSPLVPVGLGAGGVGLVFGVVTGILSLDRASDVKDTCFDGRICPRSSEDARDESLLFAHLATGGFVVAGLGVVVGVIGLLVSGGPPPRAGQTARFTAEPGGFVARF